VSGIWLAAAVAAAVVGWLLRDRIRRRAIPRSLRVGQPLPYFEAEDENGNPVSSSDLRGRVAVLLFVRGTWCPFCSKQVRNLTRTYREINETGARLVLITPRPLEVTRRVADMFGVEFEFWLDRSLAAASILGLVLESGVPESSRPEYGPDTLWPTSLVVDAEGRIRYTELSRFIVDRPDPETLLRKVGEASS